MSEYPTEAVRAVVRRHLSAMVEELAGLSCMTCHVRIVLKDPIVAVAEELAAFYHEPSEYMLSNLHQTVRHLEKSS